MPRRAAREEFLRRGGRGTAPALEGISRWCLRLDGDGGKEFAGETVRGYGKAIDGQTRFVDIGAECGCEGRRATKLHARITLHVVNVARLVAGVEFVDKVVSRAPRAAPFVGKGLFDAGGKLGDDFAAAVGLEDTSGDKAEGVGELFPELGVIKHVEENGDHLNLGGQLSAEFATKGIEGEDTFALECAEGVADAECAVKVEDDEAEAAVLRARAEGLQVVLRPVPVAEVELQGDVVDEVVDIDKLLDFLIDCIVGGVFCQAIPAVEGILCAGHLDVVAVGRDFKLVLLFGAEAVVGVGKVLVVRLTHVDESDVVAVDEVHDRDVGLAVGINARTGDDGLQGGILDAAVAVVAAVADLDGLVLIERLLFEDGVVVVVFVPVVLSVGLELEGVVSPTAAPAAARREVHFLIDDHTPVLGDEFEVDGAVPVHVPVAFGILSVARTTVGTSLKQAVLAAVEVVVVGGYG